MFDSQTYIISNLHQNFSNEKKDKSKVMYWSAQIWSDLRHQLRQIKCVISIAPYSYVGVFSRLSSIYIN